MMAMMDVAYMLPTGGLTAQADWLGPKVGGHLALLLHSSREPFAPCGPCNRLPMLRRVRNCRSYYYYYYSLNSVRQCH